MGSYIFTDASKHQLIIEDVQTIVEPVAEQVITVNKNSKDDSFIDEIVVEIESKQAKRKRRKKRTATYNSE